MPQNALARRNEQNAQLIDADIIVEQNVRFAPESTSIADITSARWRIRDRERRQQFGSETGLASNTDGP
jgi:predicted ABC-type ATPase